ncbi:MAG: hypothetical protein WBV78_16580 [Roseobacter sp.]
MEVLAKSRKSNKANQKVDGGNETPQEAEKIVSSEELEAAVTDDSKVSETDKTPDDAVAENATAGYEAVDDASIDKTSDKTVTEGGPDVLESSEPSEGDENTPDDAEASDAEGESDKSADTNAKEDAPIDADQMEDVLASEAGVTDKTDADDAEADKTEESAKAEVAPRPQPKPEPEVVRGSIWPAFFGGVIAALIGFIAGRGDMLDGFFPPDELPPAIDVTAIEATASEQAAALAAQGAILEEQGVRLEALEAASASAEQEAVPAAITEAVASLQGELETIAARISELEGRPVETGGGVEPEAVSELQAALDAQKAEIDALAARAEAAESEAAGEAARILARAALLRVVTAVDSGESFAPALEELETVTPVQVPDPLRAAAETGVPTAASLQESFPDAARTALAAARAEVPESEAGGITEFLKRQLNVRSVVPREGDDPDAVLSRAQAAVNAGDINTALTELEALSETGRAAMSDWLEAAAARSTAQNAANELADSLNSN